MTRNEPECVCNIPNLVNEFGIKAVHSLPLMRSLQLLRAGLGDLRAASFDARVAELQLLEFGVQCIPAQGLNRPMFKQTDSVISLGLCRVLRARSVLSLRPNPKRAPFSAGDHEASSVSFLEMNYSVIALSRWMMLRAT